MAKTPKQKAAEAKRLAAEKRALAQTINKANAAQREWFSQNARAWATDAIEEQAQKQYIADAPKRVWSAWTYGAGLAGVLAGLWYYRKRGAP